MDLADLVATTKSTILYLLERAEFFWAMQMEPHAGLYLEQYDKYDRDSQSLVAHSCYALCRFIYLSQLILRKMKRGKRGSSHDDISIMQDYKKVSIIQYHIIPSFASIPYLSNRVLGSSVLLNSHWQLTAPNAIACLLGFTPRCPP